MKTLIGWCVAVMYHLDTSNGVVILNGQMPDLLNIVRGLNFTMNK